MECQSHPLQNPKDGAHTVCGDSNAQTAVPQEQLSVDGMEMRFGSVMMSVTMWVRSVCCLTAMHTSRVS